MTKKILIVTKSQFGYLVDTLKYCQYLNQEFDITFLSWDFGLPRIEVEGVIIKYLKRDGSNPKRYLNFLRGIIKEIKTHEYHLIFFVYFPGASAVKLLTKKQCYNLDIRTASVVRESMANWFSDKILKLESRFFKNISVISEGLAKRLEIKKYHLLPLGGESFCKEPKSFKNIHLLYVGTLENRNIISCVKGFHQFLKENKLKNTVFTIIGDSPANELEEINQYISDHQLEKFIHTKGYIHNTMLGPYFSEANIGVSFVPMTKYYEHQPPTKTFEYLLSGMPVLATQTYENSKIVDDTNGVLIKDTASSFKEGIEKLASKMYNFDSNQIQKNSALFHWKKVIDQNLKDYLDEISKTG